MSFWDKKPEIIDAEPVSALVPTSQPDFMAAMGRMHAEHLRAVDALSQEVRALKVDLEAFREVFQKVMEHHKLEVEFIPGHHEVRKAVTEP